LEMTFRFSLKIPTLQSGSRGLSTFAEVSESAGFSGCILPPRKVDQLPVMGQRGIIVLSLPSCGQSSTHTRPPRRPAKATSETTTRKKRLVLVEFIAGVFEGRFASEPAPGRTSRRARAVDRRVQPCDRERRRR
jgi:hypothetical protein